MLKKFCLPPWVGIEPSAFVLMLYWLSYRGLGIQLHSMRNYYQLEYTRVLYCSAHAQLEFWNLRILALQRKQPQKHPYKIASWALVWDSFWLICDKKLVDVLWQTRCCVKINHLFFLFFFLIWAKTRGVDLPVAQGRIGHLAGSWKNFCKAGSHNQSPELKEFVS